MPADSVSVLQGATNVKIDGGTIDAAAGNMIVNDSGRRTTNYDSNNTTHRTYNDSNNNYSRNNYSTHTTRNIHAGTVNNFGSAHNVNTGENHGTINQNDNRGAPSRVHDNNGQGSRLPYPRAYSTGPSYEQAPQYYGYPPLQLPSTYPHRGYPPGAPQYPSYVQYGPPSQGYHPYPSAMEGRPHASNSHYPAVYPMDARNAEISRASMEGFRADGSHRSEDGDEPNHLPFREGFVPASHPSFRSDMGASGPPTIASSNESAQGLSSSPRKKTSRFRNLLSKDKDRS